MGRKFFESESRVLMLRILLFKVLSLIVREEKTDVTSLATLILIIKQRSENEWG
jgi:hypothetical protein